MTTTASPLPVIRLEHYGDLYRRVHVPRCTLRRGAHCPRVAARLVLLAAGRQRRSACLPCLRRWCRRHGYAFHARIHQLNPIGTA
jgi:hypothetical protein